MTEAGKHPRGTDHHRGRRLTRRDQPFGPAHGNEPPFRRAHPYRNEPLGNGSQKRRIIEQRLCVAADAARANAWQPRCPGIRSRLRRRLAQTTPSRAPPTSPSRSLVIAANIKPPRNRGGSFYGRLPSGEGGRGLAHLASVGSPPSEFYAVIVSHKPSQAATMKVCPRAYPEPKCKKRPGGRFGMSLIFLK
jgi:hypothetical protein